MAREDGPEFVRWREEFLSQERGSRVVHYYLEDADGVTHLAVVGTERSLRHMLYVVSEDFLGAQGCGGDSGPGVLARKWRSRREVVDWLESLLPAKTLASSFQKFGPRMGNDIGLDGYGETGSFVCHNLVTNGSTDIIWSGPFWTCSKQLHHYQAFCRNGTTISTHSFVLVMSEEENRYLAYLEDMYEDKKGHKKVKVRWFHQNQEFACAIPPPPPHPCEIFITPYSQVISVECVDDIATVLTLEHYEKYANTSPKSSLVAVRFCFRQYNKNKFKHFDLRTMRGYYSQAAVLSLKVSPELEKDGSDTIKAVNHCTPGKTKYSKQFERLYSKCLGTKICRGPQADSVASNQKLTNRQSPKKHISVKFIGPQNQPMPTYNVGDKIEALSQDSGIVGCWFRCTVLKLCSHNKLKIQYDDLQNADDSGKLEERVPASTLALPDKLGLRCPDRLRIRPCPQENSLVDIAALLPGTVVDIWQFSGWWEGVVVSADKISSDCLQVYFPGENFFRVCQLKDARISKDWVKNRWVDIEMKTDVLLRIPPVGAQTKQPDYVTPTGGLDSVSSPMSNQDLAVVQANSSGDKQTGVDKQAEVSVADAISASLEDTKQTILGEQPRDSDAEQDRNREEIGAGSQTEVILSDKVSTSIENEKQTILGIIQPGNDDIGQDCIGEETGAHAQIEFTLSKISASVEDEKKTILGNRPRDNNGEQTCNGHVSILNDKGFASLDDDDDPTKLGKRPREDTAEQNCNGHASSLNDKAFASLEDDGQTILGKRPRDDVAEQKCNEHISSLNDKACASLEVDERTISGKRPRVDDAEHKAFASLEEDGQTTLGKRPRDDVVEQKCNEHISSLNDKACASLEVDERTISGKRPSDADAEHKAFASLEEDGQTTLGKRPRDDVVEQKCNEHISSLNDKASASLEVDERIISGKRPSDDDAEQHCKDEVVSSLTDKASAPKEDEAQTISGNRSRGDDTEQDRIMEVGVEVDAGDSTSLGS